MRIAVVGAGPSGLMAAWAAMQQGHSVDLFDKNHEVVARSHGVFYLHDPCDLPTLPRQEMITGVMGYYYQNMLDWSEIRRRYAQKVYGDPDQAVSIDSSVRTIYHAGVAIQWLKELLTPRIFAEAISGYKGLLDLLQTYHRVIVTAPARAFLGGDFKSSTVWVRHAEVGQVAERGFCFYNVGEANWCRWSCSFGVMATEYMTQVPGSIQVRKVITADRKLFEAAPSEILWTGRYGAWDKSLLTHTTYRDVLDRLK